MTREEIRRENARRLAEKAGGKSDFARILDMEPSQVSQLIGPKPTKNIGNNIAKRIEIAFGQPPGSLDLLSVGEDVAEYDVGGLPRALDLGATPTTVGIPNTEVIPVRLVNLRLQAGFPRFEADEVFDDGSTIDLPRQWVEENQLVPNCLLAIKVRGPSMEPMIFEDETIVINIADTKPVSGQVFALNYDGKAVVKQMVFKNREWWLHSFNPDDEFRPVMARSGEAQVIGKMVYQPGRSLIGKL